MPEDKPKRMFFHSFDAFRFIAFLLVFISHLRLDNHSYLKWFGKSGALGVGFFFVLSGFLITYIILWEKETLKFFSIKKFFQRRILRIWPLFYAMLLFAFVTPYILGIFNLPSSDEGYEPNWLASVLFLENYVMMYTKSFPNVSPMRLMWSLCIEEHFYLTWGIAGVLVAQKNLFNWLVFCLITPIFIRFIYIRNDIYLLDLFTYIDYFAYGALPAYALFYKKEWIEKIESISTKNKIFFALLVLVLVFFLPHFIHNYTNVFAPVFFGSLFSLLIFFTLCSKNYLKVDDKHLFSKLGKYTYGLYLYHAIIVNLIFQLQNKFNISLNIFLLAAISLVITIGISFFSYHLFEKQFLKLKRY